MYHYVTICIILFVPRLSHTRKRQIGRGYMNIPMPKQDQHFIHVSVRLTAIGQLNIHGRSHPVVPLELTQEKLVFLCPWDIPHVPSLRLVYELDDSFDRLQVPGQLTAKEPWGSRQLMTAVLQASSDDKLRITGMLNRMMAQHFHELPIWLYSRSGYHGAGRWQKGPVRPIIQ